MSWEWSPIACNEEHGTRNEDYGVGSGISCSVGLRVSAANKNALINDLLTNSRAWPDPVLLYPPRAKTCKAVPVAIGATPTTPFQSFDFSEYIVTVSYSSEESLDIVAETLEPTADFLRLDHTFYRWKTSGAPLSAGEAPAVLQPAIKLTRQFFNRAAVPNALLLPGHCHNASWTSPTFGISFGAKTLMLTPQPVTTKKTTTGGSPSFDYGASFHYNPYGWNKFLRIDTGTYDEIVGPTGATVEPYPPANLLALLV